MTQGNKSGLRVSLLTFCVFLLFISLWWSAARWYRGHLINEKRAEVAGLININGNSLSNDLIRRFALIEGLRVFTKTEVHSKGGLARADFDNFASGLYAGAKGIRVIQAMPGGVVRFVYPMSGNEKTLGHDILNDPRPEVREDVKRTIRTRETALSNPYELRQSGLGVVERLAVYKSDDTFWGLVVIVLDIPPLLDAAGITLPESKVELSLRDKSGRVFHGREDVFLSEPVIYRIALPDGHWELAGIPKSGWRSSVQTPLMAFQGICLMIVLMVTGIFYMAAGRQISLATAVRQRTSELALELEKRKKSEKELLETTMYNRMLFEQSTIGLVLCRMDGSLVDVNEASANIIGRTVKEALKLTYWDITPEKYASQEQEQLESLKTTGSYGPYEKEYIHKSGRLVPVKLQGRVIEQKGEKMIWSSVEDITERKMVEKDLLTRETQLRLFVEHSPAAIAMFDREMKYLVASRRWHSDYDLGDRQIIGRSHYDIFPDLPERWKEIHKRCLAGAVEMCEEDPFPRSDGRIDWVRWEIHPWYETEGEIGGIILFSEVITERKRAEEEIRIINEELVAINRIITAATGLSNINEILETVLDEAIGITGLEGGTICMVTPQNTLRLAVHRATSEATILDLTTNEIRVGECLCGECARDHKPLILLDREAVLKFATREATRGEDIRFHAAFPLITGGKCLGVLCVFTRTDKKPEERRLKLLETVTAQIALAVQNASLFEESLRNAAELEEKVKERTAELEDKTAKLERLNRIFVGRELRMKELKERIKEMEGSRGKREGKEDNADGS